jgi:hypothetical protein
MISRQVPADESAKRINRKREEKIKIKIKIAMKLLMERLNTNRGNAYTQIYGAENALSTGIT